MNEQIYEAMRAFIRASVELEVRKALPAAPEAKVIAGPPGPAGKDGRDGIASVDQVKAFVAKAVDDRLDAEVQKRVAEAFATLPALQYRGVFKEASEYRPGDCVTFGGSLWHCNAATTDKPGDGSESWTLAVKHGRDGKDATRR